MKVDRTGDIVANSTLGFRVSYLQETPHAIEGEPSNQPQRNGAQLAGTWSPAAKCHQKTGARPFWAAENLTSQTAAAELHNKTMTSSDMCLIF